MDKTHSGLIKQKAKKDKQSPFLDKSEVQNIDFNDIIKCKDESAAEESAPLEYAGYVIEHPFFKKFMIFVVISSCIVSAIQADPFFAEDYRALFSLFEYFTLTTFILEVGLKWYTDFSIFWKDGWNILDCVVTVGWCVGALLLPESEHGILGVFRVVRFIRWLSSMQGFSLIITVILQSLLDLFSLFMLLGLMMEVFAVIGAIAFQDTVPKLFGDLSSAMLTLFICFTQDGWMGVFQQFESPNEGPHFGATVYFFTYFIAAFTFASIFVAVLNTNLETEIGRQEQNLAAKKQSDDKKIIHVKKATADPDAQDRQIPWTQSSPEKISFTQIPKLLYAMRQNEQERMKICKELRRIVDAVHSLTPNRVRDEEVLLRNQQAALIREKLLADETVTGRGGDILTTLITLQNANVIDTGGEGPHLSIRGFGWNIMQRETRESSYASAINATEK